MPTFDDLATMRAHIEAGQVRLSQAARRQIERADRFIFAGINGYGDECYDLVVRLDSRRRQTRPHRVFLAPFSRPTAAGYYWKIQTAPVPE